MNIILNVLVVIIIGVCQSVPISISKSWSIRYGDDRNLEQYRYSNDSSRNAGGESEMNDNKGIFTVPSFYALTEDNEGRPITTYASDENGYRPSTQNGEPLAPVPVVVVPFLMNFSLLIQPATLATLAGGGLG